MFEGILSLMQMAKTNALLARLSTRDSYISILTHRPPAASPRRSRRSET